MKTFSKLQKEEILYLISVRLNTIQDDPESASEFEAKEGTLELLSKKVMSDNMNFTSEEAEWLKDELQNRIDIAFDNESIEGRKVYAYAKSIQNAIDKISYKMKTIHHKWFPLKGFKTFQCSRCGVIKRWDTVLGKDVYELRGKGYFMALPRCVLPNCRQANAAFEETKKFNLNKFKDYGKLF